MSDETYPVSREFFETEIEPYLKDNKVIAEKAPDRDHYKLFCNMFYVLENENANVDLSKEYDCAWHELYISFIASLDDFAASKAG